MAYLVPFLHANEWCRDSTELNICFDINLHSLTIQVKHVRFPCARSLRYYICFCFTSQSEITHSRLLVHGPMAFLYHSGGRRPLYIKLKLIMCRFQKFYWNDSMSFWSLVHVFLFLLMSQLQFLRWDWLIESEIFCLCYELMSHGK